MIARYLVTVLGLVSAEAYGQYQVPSAPPPTNTIPSLQDASKPYNPSALIQPPKPAATIREATNAVPQTREGIQPSSLTTIAEPLANGAAVARGSRILRATGRIVGRILGPVDILTTGYSVGSDLYRHAECAKNGDQAGADRALAEAEYDALGAVPVIGLFQACVDVAGNLTVGADAFREGLIRARVLGMQQERAMEARGFYATPPHLFTLGENPYQYWDPPEDNRARRNATFAGTRQANEQAAAERSARAAHASGTDLSYMNEMMWTVLPAAIAAQQQRTIQPPRVAPTTAAVPDPCPQGQFQNWSDRRCYSWGDALGRLPTGTPERNPYATLNDGRRVVPADTSRPPADTGGGRSGSGRPVPGHR